MSKFKRWMMLSVISFGASVPFVAAWSLFSGGASRTPLGEYQGVSAAQIEDRFRDGDSTLTVYRLTSGERVLVIVVVPEHQYARGVTAVRLGPLTVEAK